jgi:hypothetical protein
MRIDYDQDHDTVYIRLHETPRTVDQRVAAGVSNRPIAPQSPLEHAKQHRHVAVGFEGTELRPRLKTSADDRHAFAGRRLLRTGLAWRYRLACGHASSSSGNHSSANCRSIAALAW